MSKNSSLTLEPNLPSETNDQALWAAIRNRTTAIGFERYRNFIDEVFCGTTATNGSHCGPVDSLIKAQSRDVLSRIGHGTNAFDTLQKATEAFLLLNCGVYLSEGKTDAPDTQAGESRHDEENVPCQLSGCADAGNLGTSEGLFNENDESSRLPQWGSTTVADIKTKLSSYLGDTNGRLPYLHRIVETLDEGSTKTPLCPGYLQARVDCPCLLELIWNYWMEAAGLVQSMKNIALRFQNRRSKDGRDPLASMDIASLYPLNHMIWGYIQDEHNRLSVVRRSFEYAHHYGITLKGKAIPELNTADSRSNFLEGFHHLLRSAIEYYKTAENTYVIPDGFKLLNSLKGVHLELSRGAGNQFGDLPWRSRVEMLMEQWILARSEMRDFLGGRVMVPYPEAWQGHVDTMRKLQGWGDTSVRYFYDLATFGERLLLSVRYGDWSTAIDENQAKNWANYWRQEIQGYVHAYRVVTSVDLSDAKAEPEMLARMKMSPADLMEEGKA